jgi:hypothetical protein
MLQIPQNASSRQLDLLATAFLVEFGCSPDGDRIEDFDAKQRAFERRISYAAKRDHHTLN